MLGEIIELAKLRIGMLDQAISDKEGDRLSYIATKACQDMANFCNISDVEYFPKDAKFYLAEYVAGEYLLELKGYHPRYEDIRREAKNSLLAFRRIRW